MKGPCLRTSLLLAVAALVLPAIAHAGDRDEFQVAEATIADIQAAFRSGELTPEDLVKMYLARIAAFDQGAGQPLNGGTGQQPLNGFMHVNEHAADDADLEDDGGRPLFGIPIILKDNIATKDMPTTAGSVALGGSRPKKDAFIAAKLRRAGAIILGKGTLTEFANFIALGMPTGFSSQLRFQLFQNGGDLSKVGFGFNAYDPRIDPRKTAPANDGRPVLQTGGSSSGPGIAVGANLATVGVGTETSGSILSPSGQNGLAGIKPTLGLVSRHGIVPITADQDTAGPMARTVTDAAKLLGVLAGFDEKDPATAACLTPGKCFSDYTKFLNPKALKGAHIAVPKKTYFIDFGLGAARTALMNDAIATMTSLGATFEECEIPSQNILNNYGTCVTSGDVKARRATPAGAIPPCSTVLMFGFKRDLNSYLADADFGPGVSASSASIPVRTVRTLSDVVSFNAAHPEVGLKYGQAIAVGSDILNTGPGEDLRNYQADRALDLKLTRTCGLDVLYTGVVPPECAGLVADQGSCKGKKFDAVLFPANFGANAPARAGYPSVIVPGGFFPNLNTAAIDAADPNFHPKQSPFGVTFSGPAFSEPKLIGFAYAFEQATQHRVSPPPLQTSRNE
ncbi:MAG TPA: amidase family protein [Myxococcales bacterium]|nr:amidase family protein [Myxococcales bacterium]